MTDGITSGTTPPPTFTNLTSDALIEPGGLSSEDLARINSAIEISPTGRLSVLSPSAVMKIPVPVLPKPKPRKYCYIGVSDQDQLAGRHWLAEQMKARGFRVLLGTNEAILACLPEAVPGLYVAPHARENVGTHLATACAQGHLVAVADDSLLGDLPTAMTISPEHIRRGMVHLWLAPGADSSIELETFDVSHAITAGSLLYANAPAELGRDLVVYTMAAGVRSIYAPPTQAHVNQYVPVTDELIPRLAELLSELTSDRRVVIVPQKGENLRSYYPLCAKLPNVVLVGAGASMNNAAVVFYVSGARAGVEACAMGIPAVRIGEGGGVSSRMGIPARDAAEAVMHTRFFLKHEGATMQTDELYRFAAPCRIPEILENAWRAAGTLDDVDLSPELLAMPAVSDPITVDGAKMVYPNLWML